MHSPHDGQALREGRADEFLASSSGQVAAAIAARAGQLEILKYFLRISSTQQIGVLWLAVFMIWMPHCLLLSIMSF
jgi:hypothetical protein